MARDALRLEPAVRRATLFGDSVHVLLDAGIVGKRKDGNRTYYRIVDQGVFSLCDQVCGTLQRQFSELGALLEGTGSGRGGGRG